MSVSDQPVRQSLSTRRLTVGEIFDAASNILRGQWLAVAVVAALFNVPLAVIDHYWITGKMDSESLPSVLAGAAASLVIGLIAMIPATAYTQLAAEALEGRRPAVPGLILRSIRHWLPLVLTGLLGGIIVYLLLFCLVIPGIIWAIYYTFIVPVVVLRELRYKTALDYSKSLVQGRWWRTAGIAFVSVLPLLTVGVILALPGALFRSSLPAKLVMSFLTAPATAFQYFAMTLFFLNEEAVRGHDRLREPAWLRPATAEPGEAAGPPPGPIYP